jgi:uncharacterized membrane protein YdjX (TVP38/TMEM64 family)
MELSSVPVSVGSVRVRLFLLSAAITVIATALLVGLAINAHGVADLIEEGGAAELPLMLIAIALLTPALVSAGLLAAAAGYALGLPVGFPVALAGLTAGALLATLLVRRVASPAAAGALGARAGRLAAWLESRPLRSVVFARLVPGLPFAIVSYVCGLTAISMSRLALGTAVGFAPRCFVYVALGGSIRDLGSPEAKAAIVATVAIAVLSLAAPRIFAALGLRQATETTTEPRYRWMT